MTSKQRKGRNFFCFGSQHRTIARRQLVERFVFGVVLEIGDGVVVEPFAALDVEVGVMGVFVGFSGFAFLGSNTSLALTCKIETS